MAYIQSTNENSEINLLLSWLTTVGRSDPADWQDNLNDICNYAVPIPVIPGSYLIDTIAKFAVKLNTLRGDGFFIDQGYIYFEGYEDSRPISALQLGRNYLIVQVRQPFKSKIIVKPVFFIGGYRELDGRIIEDKGLKALDTYPIGYEWVTFSKQCWNRGRFPYLRHILDSADNRNYRDLLVSCNTERDIEFNPKTDQVNSILIRDALPSVSDISIYDPMKMVHTYRKEGGEYLLDKDNIIQSSTGPIGKLNRHYWRVTIVGIEVDNYRFLPLDKMSKNPLDVVYYYKDPKEKGKFLRQRGQPVQSYIKLERKILSGNTNSNHRRERS
jgi:hypothetical protein